MSYNSELMSLDDIVRQEDTWIFTVPIYQRLYVWGHDEVNTLLNDLVNAYENSEGLFFLGGALVVEQPCENGRKFELIDGQQRFTTLWMLCHVWRGALESFLTVKKEKRTMARLEFAIRPAVNRFLQSLIFTGHQEGEEEIARETRHMREAIATMESLFQRRSLPKGTTREEYLDGLSRFVFDRVKLVLTTVPEGTDLNKLFEVVNNRGVQLQHHEILKAQMLDALDEGERGSYAILWDTCADMREFAERGLAANSGILAKELAGLCDREAIKQDTEQLLRAETVLKFLNTSKETKISEDILDLNTILANEGPTAEGSSENHSDGEGTKWIRSIVGFPMFLQHTLRIWLDREGLSDLRRILDRELLDLFKEHFFDKITGDAKRERCRSFIKLLWELRYLFDKHFIKWVDRGEEEIHMISALRRSDSDGSPTLNRSRETEGHQGFGLLQSMLYHSQEITTHYWITPLLSYIYKNPGKVEIHYEYLRHLDTYLLGSTEEGSLIDRTKAFMENPWARPTLNHSTELRQENGLRFRHYWFYKLEFVLWYLQKNKDAKWARFRFTAKNSVEHISPQSQMDRDNNTVKLMLNRFGNLALVSRSVNSEYSNRPFNEKQRLFQNKNQTELDSLKMSLIYESEIWNDSLALTHEDKMISKFDAYVASLPH